MRFTALSTLTLAAAVALAACDDSPLTAPSGGTADVPVLAKGGAALDRIVYANSIAGETHIYSMKSSGRDLVRLTSLGVNYLPRWTPDHSKIVFNSERNGLREIFSMNADGSNQVQLTNIGCLSLSPAPSPDGSKIVFVVNSCIADGIYTINMDGSNLTQLTAGVTDGGPTWAPDGSTIVFSRHGVNNGWDIWSMHADGTNPIMIVPCGGEQCHSPIYSPDGTRLAFQSTADGGSIVVHQPGKGTVAPVKNTGTIFGGARPAWSPDGKKLVFSKKEANGATNLYTVNATDGSGLKAITAVPGFSVSASWYR